MNDSEAVVPVTWQAMPGLEGAEQGRGKMQQHDTSPTNRLRRLVQTRMSERSSESAECVKGRAQQPQERHRPAVWAC